MKKSDVIKVLMGIGVSKGSAEKIAADVPDTSTTTIEDKDITALVGDFKKNQNDLFENDSDFISKIQKKEYSKNKDIFIRKMKQRFGLTADEIKTVTKTKKDGDETIEIIDVDDLIELAGTKATASKDKNVDTLQQELLTANNIIKNLQEVEIPKIKATADTATKSAKIAMKLEKKVAGFGDKLRVKVDAAMPALMANLQSKGFDVDLDDAGELVIKKGGLAVKNSDGTKLLTADEILTGSLEEYEFIKKSNADDKKDDEIIIEKDDEGTPPVQKNKVMNSNLSRAEKHAEQLKKNKV